MGWCKLPLMVSLMHDTSVAELSAGQFTFAKGSLDAALMHRGFKWNTLVHRSLSHELQRKREILANPSRMLGDLRDIGGRIDGRDLHWVDARQVFTRSVSVSEGTIRLIVDLNASAPVSVRLALIDDSDQSNRGVLETWFTLEAGVSSLTLEIANFTVIQ